MWITVAPASAIAAQPTVTQPGATRVVRGDDRLVRLAVPAADERGNGPDRTALVWLPPDYESSAQRYRTLYLLHEHGARAPGHDAWLHAYEGFHLGRALDALHARGELAADLIVIAVDGTNGRGHEAYQDSPVTGAWSAYVTRDVVAAVDRTFRTVPHAAARGIAGHSTGGSGAFALATLNPDIFGAVYAMSPCCTTLTAHWQGQTPLRLADSLSDNLARLRGIAFDAGREDPHREVPAVIPLLDSLLIARGVPHLAELYTGDHRNRIPERLLTRVLPFMDDVLTRTP